MLVLLLLSSLIWGIQFLHHSSATTISFKIQWGMLLRDLLNSFCVCHFLLSILFHLSILNHPIFASCSEVWSLSLTLPPSLPPLSVTLAYRLVSLYFSVYWSEGSVPPRPRAVSLKCTTSLNGAFSPFICFQKCLREMGWCYARDPQKPLVKRCSKLCLISTNHVHS